MTGFEKVLQECLHEMDEGASGLEECLSRHPRYAAQLRPILLARADLERAGAVPVSEEFKTRVRAKVMQDVRAHPRKSVRSVSMFLRFSISLAATLLTLLATGTAFAQGALPGNAFYTWKLASESAWRAVSSDPVGTDLKIAARRADELIAVSKDPVLFPQALKTYLATAARLRSEANVENKTRILPLLDSQTRKLSQSGVVLPLPGNDISPLSEPTASPVTAPPAATSLPLLVSPTPQPYATRLLQLTPTVQEPLPKVAPPVQAPPKIVPTLHSPPNVAPTTRSQIP